MSRSSYSDRDRTMASTSTGVEDRDFESRRDRERDRVRNADNYGESRHHGKWTASGEVTDLEGGNYSRSGNTRAASRSYSDSDDYDYQQQQRRNRGLNTSGNYGSQSQYGPTGQYGSSSQYGSSYPQGGYGGNIPTPPPMPPADFYMPHSSYRQSHPYSGAQSHDMFSSSYPTSDPYGGLGHYGGSSYGLGSGFHDSQYGGFGSGFGGYGGGVHPQHYHLMMLQSQQGGMGGLGGLHGSDYYFGQPGYGSQQSSGLGLGRQSRGVTGGMGGLGGLTQGMSRLSTGGLGGLGGNQQGRPQCDIYELGNEYIIEVDLPGHQRDHVDIKLSGNELFIVSRPPKREHNFHINERSLGRHIVERKFYLPADVNGSNIAPVLSNGVLRVTLPRTQTTTGTTGATGVLAATQQPHKSVTTTTDTATTSTTTNQATVV